MDRLRCLFRMAPRPVLLLAACSLLVSCAQRRTLSRDDLRSDLTAAISIASETEISIEFVLHGQATSPFASGHFRYLAQQLQDTVKETADARPAQGLQQAVASSHAQLDMLSRTLTSIGSDTLSTVSLNEAKQRVSAIRKALEHENASL